MPPEDAQEKHVFVSYVHENSDEVDKLCAVLDAVNIPYWRDRSKLGPGDEWKVKIREDWRSSPWLRMSLRLNTVAEARERLRSLCESRIRRDAAVPRCAGTGDRRRLEG